MAYIIPGHLEIIRKLSVNKIVTFKIEDPPDQQDASPYVIACYFARNAGTVGRDEASIECKYIYRGNCKNI